MPFVAIRAVCCSSSGLSDNVMSVCFWAAGATISLDFTPDFDLQQYRDRVVQTLLSQVHQPDELGRANETTSHLCR